MSDPYFIDFLNAKIEAIQQQHPRTVGGQVAKQTALRELRTRIEELKADEEPNLMRTMP